LEICKLTSEIWEEPESIWEIRKRAPFHFLAKADNARFSAYCLAQLTDERGKELAGHSGYGGTPGLAIYEAFLREASISIELILKAIICEVTKTAPTPTHDVYDLWSKAGLPEMSDDDMYRLAHMSEILYWSGRYGAPKSEKSLQNWDVRSQKHQRTKLLGSLKVTTGTPLEWEEFNHLYSIACRRFWELDPNHENAHG
jgi:hypothetical protein